MKIHVHKYMDLIFYLLEVDVSDKDEYPPDLKAATRAEYVNMIRQYKKDQEPKKPGCPLMLLAFLGVITFIGSGIVGTVLYIL